MGLKGDVDVVVDSKGKVFDVRGLRVIDASSFFGSRRPAFAGGCSLPCGEVGRAFDGWELKRGGGERNFEFGV